MDRWQYDLVKKFQIEDRCKQEAEWLIDHLKDGVRKIAREFGISKSQVHRDLHAVRDLEDRTLWEEVELILRRHNGKR